MIYMTRKRSVCCAWISNSLIVLYPLLNPGDRVTRGPDWQWGNQGANGEGTVIRRKEWKGVKDQGVCVHWDTGENNVYRYGANYCYDVIE